LPENCFSFFDFDNTLYKGQSRYLILDFSTYLEAQGVFKSQELQHLRSLLTTYHEGRINRHDFAVQVVKSYYCGLTGCLEIEIAEHACLYWNHLQAEAWFPYTHQLLNLVNKFTTTILISGSPLEVLQHAIKPLGFREIYASKGVIHTGVYTGSMEQEMATQTAKARLMGELSTRLSFNPTTSFAFGDSESDFPMLQVVDPINAYLLGAKDDLKNEVMDKNWNLLEQDTKILEHVQARINTLYS
jgi:HAD superfamily phosphoserine phosphatase-like hydrolase